VSHTEEVRRSLPRLAVENIGCLLRGDAPVTLVNPEALSAWRARSFKPIDRRT
jgi:hypothetical protein